MSFRSLFSLPELFGGDLNEILQLFSVAVVLN